MARTRHELASVGLSVLAGMVFAMLACLGDIGLVLSPAALFARWDKECRVSFAWVVVPTAAVTLCVSLVIFLSSLEVGAGLVSGFLVSVPTYLLACVVVGLLAIPRRRRLRWYESGCCSHCGYDVRNLREERCPECGKVARLRPPMRVAANVLRAES